MAVEVGKAYIPVDGDFSKFDRDTKAAVGRARSRFAGLAKIAAGGFALGGGAVAAKVAKDSIAAASDVNESLSKNRVLFGEYAKGIVEVSESSAKSFGISKKALLEYTGTFGNLFRALGINRRESAKFSVDLTRLAADMASFNNTSPEEALEAIRSGLVGETEPLRKFGVNLQDATLRQEALRLRLVKTTKEALTPQTKALAAQSLIVKQTTAAHGDFARTSSGLANQQRVLSAQWDDMKAKLGKALLPVLKSAVTSLNQFVTGMQTGKGAGGDFVRTMKDVGAVLSAVVKFLGQHRTALKVLIGLWVAYRVAAIAAIAKTRLALIGQFLGLKRRAIAAGAASGLGYGRAFVRAAGPLIAAAVAADALINPDTAGQPVGEERRSLARARRGLYEHRRRMGLDIHGQPLHKSIFGPHARRPVRPTDDTPSTRRRRIPAHQLSPPHAPSGRMFRSMVIENVNVMTPVSGAPDGRHLIAQLDLLAAARG